MKFSFLTLLLALMLAPRAVAQTKTVATTTTQSVTTTAASQSTAKTVRTQSTTRAEKKAETEAEREAESAANESAPAEKSAAAARDVVVSLCVASGDVVVRGWDRAEVRARVEESGGLRLDTGGGQPARRVEVIVSPNRQFEMTANGCGQAGTVELDVPRGASLSLRSQSGNVQVSEVADVYVQAMSGDIDVRRASKSVEVSGLSGDILLNDSTGPVRVKTVSGSVEVRGARPLAAGDVFDAKSTSGDVTLEGVAHAQVTGATVNGSLLYTGALARGGVYDLRTTSGDVTMELPADASFTVHARVLMSGDIVTDFPVKSSTGTNTSVSTRSEAQGWPAPPPPPDGKKPYKVKPPKPPKEESQTRLDGTVGTGDAVINLSSFSGSLRLKKR